MAISLRLDKAQEITLSRYAQMEGRSKSDLIRSLIADFIAKKPQRQSAWQLGKDVFGREGSGRGDLSVNRKALLKERLNAKRHRG